jgi:hypothetical protein
VIDIGVAINIIVGARVGVLFDVLVVDAAANVVVDVAIGVVVGVVLNILYGVHSTRAARVGTYLFQWWGSKWTVEISRRNGRPSSNGPLHTQVGTDRPRTPLNKAKASLISALSHSSLPGRRWRNARTPFRAARGLVGVLFPSADWIVIP